MNQSMYHGGDGSYSDPVTIDDDSDTDEQESDGSATSLSDDDSMDLMYSLCLICHMTVPNLERHVPFCCGAQEECKKEIVPVEKKTEATPEKKCFQAHIVLNIKLDNPQDAKAIGVGDNKTDRCISQFEIANTCKFCLRKIPQKRMAAHIRFHCSMKRFSCNNCNIKFRSVKTLNNHVSLANCVALTYECASCLRRFKTKMELSSHVITYKCDVQQVAIESSSYPISKLLMYKSCEHGRQLKKHETNFHPAISQKYGRVDVVQPNPRQDLKQKSAGLYDCPHCHLHCETNSEFQNHMEEYCPAQPFACPTCLEHFPSLAMLKFHQYDCY